MAPLIRVPVSPIPPDGFSKVLPADQFRSFQEAIAMAREVFHGRVIWNVNSTSRGGGVAEMLRSLVGYSRGAGVDTRWIVVSGNPAFFEITKRIHNNLHGSGGDGGELGDAERRIYEATLGEHTDELLWLIRPGDAVILHDPQTAGLIPVVKEAGARVVWRCHVGLDLPNDLARKAWGFLIDYVNQADAYVFSREDFAWEGLDEQRLSVIPPSIDAFSPKNQEMSDGVVKAILGASGLMEVEADDPPIFTREDQTPGRVDRRVTFADGGPAPPPEATLVVQVSRWDRLKDPVGVIKGFADHIAPKVDAHLIHAGPSAESVYDDPEGAGVLRDCVELWRGLNDGVRQRVHLAGLPMEDVEENAAIVNALQRRSDVVVQKSLAEGFGLTVAEAMWKARPVVASKIGGIQDQIEHGVTGLLVDDPEDLHAYGEAVVSLLGPDGGSVRREMGLRAQEGVRDSFLGPRHLIQWVEVLAGLLRS